MATSWKQLLNKRTLEIQMLNSEEEKSVDENDFSSIVGSSLRNVIENSVTDLVLPYRILSISHLSSWKTFQNDLSQILKLNLNINQQNMKDFSLLNDFDRYTKHLNPKQEEKDFYFQCLMNSQIDFNRIKSDFDRLRQFME